ncbi:separin [[Candida] jaroonii]|uniref:Separin n=1 Tax=[Candida] jaroonii TaxID=467808 RepID=A0ACA9YFT1_9ASCO|nr:separin [[Candida] jaroonii]
MIERPIDDLALADQRFTLFINSRNLESLNNNSPRKINHIKDTRCFANDFIDSVVSRHSGNLQDETITNAFICLYLCCSQPQDVISVLKRHQSFILELFSKKAYQESIVHLKVIHQVITNYLSNKSIKIESEDDMILTRGIEFTESDSMITNLIIAFHFLSLQCVLQLFSSNINQLITSINPFISINSLMKYPYHFISSGNFSRWLHLHRPDTSSEKHLNNVVKILSGFIKICSAVSKKVPELSITKLQFEFKLMEYKYLQDQTIPDYDFASTPSELGPYLNDLRTIIPDISIIDHPPCTAEDVIAVLNNLTKQPELINKFKSMLLNCPPDLYNNQDIMDIMISCMSNLDSKYSMAFSKCVLNYMKTNFKHFRTITRRHFQLFDSITNNCINIEDKLLLVEIISKLYFILSKFKQFKRIRNLSNLLYNNGKKNSSVECLKLSVEYEQFIAYTQQDDSNDHILQAKVEKVSNCLISLNHHTSASEILIRYLKTIEINHIEDCHNISSRVITTLVQCLDEDSITRLFGTSSEFSDIFKAALFINITTTSHPSIERIYEIIDLSDRSLSLYCTYHYSSTIGIETHIDVEGIPNGEDEAMNLLLKSGILMNNNINCEWSTKNINKSVVFFVEYLSLSVPINDYEIEVFGIIRHYLKYNQLFDVLKELLITYISSRSFESDVKLIRLDFSITMDCVDICLKFHQFEEAEKYLNRASELLKVLFASSKTSVGSNDLLTWKMAQLKYFISIDLETAGEKFSTITKFLSSKPEFSLNSQTALSLSDKLSNLLSVAQFNSIAAQLNFKKQNYAQVMSELKTGIKLTMSIMRKIPNDIDRSLHYELEWGCNSLMTDLYFQMIEILKTLGISRDLRFYIEEFRKLLDSTINPTVNCTFNYYLSNISILIGDIQQAQNFLQKADDIESMNINNNLKALRNDSHLLMAAYNKDSAKVQDCLERVFDQDIWYSNPIPSSEIRYLSSIYFDIPKFHENNIWSTLIMFKNRFLEIMKDMKNDPLFNDIENSVIISPSLQGIPKSNDLNDLKTEMVSFLTNNQLQYHEYNHLLLLLYNIQMYLSASGSSDLSTTYYHLDISRSLMFKHEKTINFPSAGIIPSSDKIDNPRTIPQDEFYSSLQSLPSNWTIITINMDDKIENLILTKLGKLSNFEPVSVKLPLNRMSQYSQNSKPIGFKDSISTLREIIAKSNDSIKPRVTSTIKTSQDRKNWWKLRFSLDLKLQELLEKIEDQWIGGFKGIFNQREITADLVDQFHALLRKVLPSKMKTNLSFNKSVVEIISGIVSSFRSESYEDFMRQNLMIEDILYYIVDSLNYKGERNSYDEIDMDTFSSGLKDMFSVETVVDNHFIIIPSPECSEIPWESLNCLSGKSVSRMPSIQSIFELLESTHELKMNEDFKLTYLINPGGDLARTEGIFTPKFSSVGAWEGVSGTKPPNSAEFLSEILERDIFVFIGHGGCEAYIKTSELLNRSHDKTLPPCLLLGCSSGALETNGIFNNNGTVYNWLIGGSPMIVANLWDVTDKDIDKFSLSVFESWNLFGDSSTKHNMGLCVRDSRKACTLKYLNGSAPIIYGLPLTL